MAEIKKVLFYGPILDISGYAHAARGYIKSLLSQGIEVESIALKIDKFEADVEPEIKDTIKLTTRAVKEAAAFIEKNDAKILFNHLTPELAVKDTEKFNIIANSWETTKIPEDWANYVSRQDLCLVSCNDNVMAYLDSGVTCPILMLPLTCDSSRYSKNYKPHHIKALQDIPFKFLTICQASPKKALETLLASYFVEFTGQDDVCLVLKSYYNGVSDTEMTMLGKFVEGMKASTKLKHYPKVMLINDNYTEDQMASLYKSCDSYALVSKGEGFSLTHFDAIGFGLHTIGVKFGGAGDLVSQTKYGSLVDGTLSPIVGAMHPYPNLYTAYEKWFEPSIPSTMEAMRLAYNTAKKDRETSEKFGLEFVKKYDYSVIGKQLVDLIGAQIDLKG